MPMSAGPFLIVAAFWQDTEDLDAVCEAISPEKFPRPDGYRGAVVSFRLDVADATDFRHTMKRLQLAEVNDRRPGFEAVS